MKICWFGIYNKSYSRNDILMSGLRQNGVELVECHADAKDPGRYRRLIRSLKSLKGDYDAVYAAYPAPVPTILAKLFTRKPVIMDAFYSMYDAVVNDRREVSWFHPRAIRLAALDWLALIMADMVIADTAEHKKYWSRWPFVKPSKIEVVYLGVNPEIFHPMESTGQLISSGAPLPIDRGKFLVHFNGTYIPLQGIEKIVEAAALLQDDDSLMFRLVGSGGNSKEIASSIQARKLRNIELVGRVPIDELNRLMSEADLILGIFGDTAKARRVIPNKVYEGMAARKPVVTMDTPAVREAFTDEDVCMIPGDPRSIADAVKRLQEDPERRDRLAGQAYKTIMERFMPEQIAGSLIEKATALLVHARRH